MEVETRKQAARLGERALWKARARDILRQRTRPRVGVLSRALALSANPTQPLWQENTYEKSLAHLH